MSDQGQQPVPQPGQPPQQPDPQQPPSAEAPAAQQPGYGPTAEQQPGYGPAAAQQPAYSAPAPQQPGYGAPTQQMPYTQPQPGYGATQQPGYAAPQQPGYPAAQPGYGQQQPGYPPQQPGYGGYPQQPGGGGYGPQPPRKSNGTIIGLSIGALVLVVLLVFGITRLVGSGSDPDPTVNPTVDPTPTQGTDPTDDPTTEDPTTDPTTGTDPTDDPTTGTPTGDAIAIAEGVSVVPAAGWSQVEAEEGFVVLSDGNSYFYGEAFATDGAMPPADLLEDYLAQVTAEGTDVEIGAVEAVDMGDGLESAIQSASWTFSDASGTYTTAVTSLATLRESDGLMTLATMFYYPEYVDPEQLDADYTAMANSIVSTM